MTGSAATRTIPFFNYKGAFTADEEVYVALFRDIIHRGAFIQQQELVDFEARLAQYLGVKHAIGVGNATDGLLMAFRAAGIKPGDEVIFPSHTMVASPASAAQCGGVPVPVDCRDDHMIDPAAIERAITPRTKFLLPVHLNGRTCDMDAISAIARKHNLTIIEDAAQGLGSKFRGRFAGTWGLAAAYSFYPAKILGCMGDGGAVVTNDDGVAHRLRLLRDHGRDELGEVQMWGLNSRLDNLQAGILDYQFRTYDKIIAHRRVLAATYQRELGELPQLLLPPAPDASPDHFDVYQNYELEAERRDELREYLKQAGIGTLLQWGGKAVHQFKGLGLSGSLPRTELLFQRCLMLPMNMMVTQEDAGYIAARIREFYQA
jgi:dTDP-4-amino-4,6-dideoxygalactose transaminase